MEPVKEKRAPAGPQTSSWDLSVYKWKVESDGLALFVKGLKDKKILGRKCLTCGTVYVPGPTYCRKCMIDIDTVVEAKDTGIIGAFTVNLADIRGTPVENPSIVVCVKLDGSDSWLMGRLEEWTDWKAVKAGMRVQIVWSDSPKGALADLNHFK